MPVELAPQESAGGAPPLRFTDSRRYPNDERLELGYNGYVNLSFRSAALVIEYRDLNAETVYREEWGVADGALRAVS
jgi:hypothetical protein